MKKIILFILTLSALKAFAQTYAFDEHCIALKLHDYNSELYENLTPKQIVALLQKTALRGHQDAVKADEACALGI